MCGGSANRRCLPPTVYGDRTNPAASRPPRAIEAASACRVGVAGRGLEADAVRGAARRRPGSCPRAGPCGRGSRRCRRARPGGRRARSPAPRGHRGRRATGRCRRGGGRSKSGYFWPSRVELDLGEVGDPDRAAARARWSSCRPGGHHVVHQPLDLAEVGGPLDLGPAAGAARRPRPGPRRRRLTQPGGLAQAAGGEAVARIEVIRSRTTRGRSPAEVPCSASAVRSSSRPTVWITRGSSGAGLNGRHGVSTSSDPSYRCSTWGSSS